MKIKFNQPAISFGVYKHTKLTDFGNCVQGHYKNFDIKVFTKRDEHTGLIDYKLYYLYKAGKWLQSKLIYFKNGIKNKIIRSESK